MRDVLTIDQRFNVSIPHPYITDPSANHQEMYILGSLICYHVEPDLKSTFHVRNPEVDPNKIESLDKMYTIKLHNIENVTYAFMAMTSINVLASTELVNTGLIGINMSKYWQYHISSHFYDYLKLPFPYSDDCINYQSIGFRSKSDSINTCQDRYANRRNMSSRLKIFTKYRGSKHRLDTFWTTLNSDLFECGNIYFNPDCHSEDVFSSLIYRPWNGLGRETRIFVVPTKHVSYEYENCAKIAHVDYVTYIFGAAGT